jgi:RNA polymerase subunit RPABC4/transcription elongation factor Spt4
MEIIIVLIAGLFFALLCGSGAGGKGRSTLGWGLIGLFFGPVALLVFLLPAVEDIREFKKCPYCAELVRNEAVVCRYCGHDICKEDNAAMSDETDVASQNIDKSIPHETRRPDLYNIKKHSWGGWIVLAVFIVMGIVLMFWR